MNAVQKHTDFDRLEAAIATLPAVEPEVVHHFAPKIYGREMRLLPGTMLTGKIHKGETLNVVCGDITVFNDVDGSKERIVGMRTFVSKPGTRRAGFAHGFTVWICFHDNPDDGQDLAQIEDRVIEKYENPLLANKTEALK